MGYVIMAGQLMLSLSILIVLHEMGHFLPARFFGTRVEKFYLFFDPWFSLFKKKVGETEYGIGWLPLGGYVKISGMIDESFDTEQMEQEPQPWEFRSKPAWQRLIIMLGGVTVNFILGFLLYAVVLFVWGEEYLPAKNAVYGIHTDSLGQEMGLRTGDHILAVGDVPFDRFNPQILKREIIINGAGTVTVDRDGREVNVEVPKAVRDKLPSYKYKELTLFAPRTPFVIEQVAKDSPAEKAGIMPNDSIVAVNGTPARFYDQFIDIVGTQPNVPVTFSLIRDGQPKDVSLVTTEEGKIGVYRYGYDRYFTFEHQEYSLGEALPAGVKAGWGFLADQVKAFGQMFSGGIKPSDSLGGFASIGAMFGDQWNWERFWKMTAILSLILAFMNLLPIPALDGGHVMFLLYEVVSGRKPSDKFMEYATMVGFILVIGLVLYANGLDFLRWFRG